MRIDPKDIRLDINERRIIRLALTAYVRECNSRAKRLHTPRAKAVCVDHAARAEDLLAIHFPAKKGS